MNHVIRIGVLLACFSLLCTGTAYAEKTGSIGIRGGIGTDITGGIAYGGQLNYTYFQALNAIEMGIAVFGGHFEEDSNNGYNDYHEETDILVVAAMVNYLFRWSLEASGPYFLAGIGAGSFSVEWQEQSPTDTSLGTLLPGGGSMQSEEGTVGGFIINFGVGHRFNQLFDLRVQAPVFFVSSYGDRDGAVVPTFTLTAGLSF
jgi:hypothetical protein